MNSIHSHRSATPKTVYTVSELNRRIKQRLETDFPFVWIAGEISNLRRPPSGHLYFTLKDSQSQLNAVMFKGQARRLVAKLEDGLAVLGMGRISVYEPRGIYQLIIEYLEPKGLGDLQLAFEQLKRNLTAEGLFDPTGKKPLPSLPRKVHVITSPTGAVIFDTISIIQRRFANIPIVLIPTAVQGDGAAEEVIQAIAWLNERQDAEVAILARGGGSLEDLQAFNDERVARAIYHSHVPIISAIGHETDYTIADFVADLRAPTPSAAAELVVPEKKALKDRIEVLERQLGVAARANLNGNRDRLSNCRERLLDPRRRVYDGRLLTDDLIQRMSIGLRRTLHDSHSKLNAISSRLKLHLVRDKISNAKQKHKQIYSNILKINKLLISNNRWKSQILESRLAALNPLAVLERGYSITRKLPQRSIIRNTRQIDIDDRVEITLASGTLTGRIEGKDGDGAQKL